MADLGHNRGDFSLLGFYFERTAQVLPNEEHDTSCEVLLQQVNTHFFWLISL